MANAGNDRWSTESVISDLISDHAANAPERDTAILAPDLCDENVAPEVSSPSKSGWG